MKNIAFPNALFQKNRERLEKKLPPRSLAILNSNDIMPTNADGSMGHIQNADLFYLAGIHQEESILVLAPEAVDPAHREILFLREPDELLTIWEGYKLTKEQATDASGIKNVKWLHEFPAIFRMLMCEMDHVFLNTNEHQRSCSPVQTRDARFIQECQRDYPLHHYCRLSQLLYPLRAIKSSFEVDAIRAACDLTRKGVERVCRFVRPGVNEAEVEAEFAHEFIRCKGQFAYSPIIASGINNCILHYNSNDLTCKDGDLLLLDVGAGLGNYASDLTRTIPVNGRYSRRQRQVYDAVLRIFRAQVAALVPGKTTKELRAECEQITAKECVDLGLLTMDQVKQSTPDNLAVKKYFMHGVSHPIGLDVHDATYNHLKIEPGWVLTVEPGIYIQEEGFGVRLENTVLVTESGQLDLMADIPIEAEAIEALMLSAR
jgi:Xaa-Pro aminopeptidase